MSRLKKIAMDVFDAFMDSLDDKQDWEIVNTVIADDVEITGKTSNNTFEDGAPMMKYFWNGSASTIVFELSEGQNLKMIVSRRTADVSCLFLHFDTKWVMVDDWREIKKIISE